jgi:methionyl-tRNA formyltransferase
MQAHIATSRELGEKIKALVPGLVSAEECDIFISILYDKIIPYEFIRSKVSCFNFHPGILPKYRGTGASSWAISNGEIETGVTLHIIDKDIDHGPIIDIWTCRIAETDTVESLFHKVEAIIFDMFFKWFDRLLEGDYTASPQDHRRARIYYRKDLEAARDLTKYVRAFTFSGRENAYYMNSKGEKIELVW